MYVARRQLHHAQRLGEVRVQRVDRVEALEEDPGLVQAALVVEEIGGLGDGVELLVAVAADVLEGALAVRPALQLGRQGGGAGAGP